MLRKKLASIVMSILLTAGCVELRHLYKGAKEVYQKVESTTEEYGVSVDKERIELSVSRRFIPIPDKFNTKLKGRVELNNVGYDLRNMRIGKISARLNLSF